MRQIETQRLLLRGHRMENFPYYWEMLNDEEARRYTGGVPKISREERKAVFQKQCESFAAGQDNEFAVMSKVDGSYLGYCGFMGGPELLYGFRRDSWGNGYATEAAKAMLQCGFDTLEYEEIVAYTYPDNRASQGVLKKIGMHSNGLVKQEDGAWVEKFTAYRENDVMT